MSTHRADEPKPVLPKTAATPLPSPAPPTSVSRQDSAGDSESSGSLWAGSLGILFAAAFYAVVYAVPWEPLKRYFLGHPVAVAATILYWVAVAILLVKWIRLTSQRSQLETIRDEDLMLNAEGGSTSPAGRWIEKHNAGVVARQWLTALAQLPFATRGNPLIVRLQELLTRQSQRGTSKHLADDLRELSARDADASHDSYSLVRIIVWAIPMLGFLGTVVGITQTLGGLDFTDGTAAVDRLKSGLYVAFDTTALGIVLSVVAIFMQFPVERGEQRLLSSIDARVGRLVSTCLPNDEAADNQTALIANLCEGIRVAVAESLAQQTDLWRSTIDEAHQRWQDVHESTSTQITDAFSNHFSPALLSHAETIDQSARIAGDRLQLQCDQWQQSISSHSDRLLSYQQSLLDQCQTLTKCDERAESLVHLQQTLDSNLIRLLETNAAIDRSVSAAAGDGMADAMRILARAVDVLSHRLSHEADGPVRSVHSKHILDDTQATRRAA